MLWCTTRVKYTKTGGGVPEPVGALPLVWGGIGGGGKVGTTMPEKLSKETVLHSLVLRDSSLDWKELDLGKGKISCFAGLTTIC